MIRRHLTSREIALVASVFGEAVDCGRVRIVSGGGFGRFAVTLGSHILVPRTLAHADYAIEHPALRGFLIHELVHVWQFQTRPLWTVASWAGVAMSGGYGRGLPGYRYALPLAAWERLNLEQQASAVEHAYLLREGFRRGVPIGARLGDYAGATPFERLQ